MSISEIEWNKRRAVAEMEAYDALPVQIKDWLKDNGMEAMLAFQFYVASHSVEKTIRYLDKIYQNNCRCVQLQVDPLS